MVTKIAIIGHPNTGKSTLVSAILVKTGNANIKSIISSNNKKNLHHLTDIYEDEKIRGMTLETNIINFTHQNEEFHLIDTPGHITLANQMINGLSKANIAVLLISIKDNEFKALIKSNTFESLFIIKCMGFNEILVIINKMDFYAWNKTRYNTIINNLKARLKKYKFTNIRFLPISSLKMENITSRFDNEICHTSLFEAIQSINQKKEQNEFIKPNNEIILGSFIFIYIDKLITIGYKAKLHSCDKVFNCELTQIFSKMKYLTNKNTKGKIIKLGLKINTDKMISPNVILRNHNNTICIGSLKQK